MDEQNKPTPDTAGQPAETPAAPSVEDLTKEIEALKAKLGQADAKDKKEILERVQTLMKQRFVRSEGKEG